MTHTIKNMLASHGGGEDRRKTALESTNNNSAMDIALVEIRTY